MSAFSEGYNFDGRMVIDRDGEKIGRVEQVYTDLAGGLPEWVLCNTGLFGSKKSFVPLSGASPRGEDICVAVDKQAVKDAPKVEAGQELSEDEERELYSHYGIAYTTEGTTYAQEGAADTTGGEQGAVGRDVSGPTTDDAMTRSEEEVRVGTQRVERGRARLRKYVVTEQVTKTVPVSHEEVRIEREPITEQNVEAATSGPEISEEEHEVVLHEERPVVGKETVPKERVRMTTEEVAGEQQVSEQVRRERIEAEGADVDPDERR